MSVTPARGVVKRGASLDVTVTIVLHCTTQATARLALTVRRGSDTIRRKQDFGLSLTKLVEVTAEGGPSARLDPDDIVQGKAIGSGAFGTVYRGTYHSQEVAVKLLNSQELLTTADIEQFKREVQTMEGLGDHPCVIRFVGSVTLLPRLSIVTEFAQFGSLDAASKARPFSTKLKHRCLLDVARGIAFLHSRKLIHRDIKPPNILIVSLDPLAPQVAKISDFGSIRIITQSSAALSRGVGSPAYMSPEILRCEKYGQPTDVYSFAIVAWELLTGLEPFPEDRFPSMWAVPQFILAGNRPAFPPDLDGTEMADLIKSCWVDNPVQRLPFSEISSSLERAFATSSPSS
jgi:serine/threonine protein kinase